MRPIPIFMQPPSPYPLEPSVPDWLIEWREAWRAAALSVMNCETTKIVSLTDTSLGESLWWLPGIVSNTLEPRTSIAGYGIFCHLWIQKSTPMEQGMDKIHLELASTVADNLLISFASIQVQQLEDVQRLSQAAVLGLEEAMEWLAMTDQETLSRWAAEDDPVFRRLAETSPYAETSTKVLGFLGGGCADALTFPLPPSKVLRCTKRFIATTVCTAILIKGEASRDGLISPLRF